MSKDREKGGGARGNRQTDVADKLANLREEQRTYYKDYAARLGSLERVAHVKPQSRTGEDNAQLAWLEERLREIGERQQRVAEFLATKAEKQ